MSVHDGERLAEVTRSLEAAVGAERFDEYWASGAEMGMDDAIQYALGV
jgi:hypothetical protein